MHTNSSAKSNHSLLSYVLALLVTVSVFTSDLYLASMPYLSEFFNTTAFNIQLTLSLYLLGFSITMLIAGPLSDKFSARPIILSGLFLHACASLLIPFCSTIEWVIACRLIQSFGGGFSSILCRMVVRQEYPKEKQLTLFAYFFIVMGTAAIVAPLLGSALFYYISWKANFIYMSLYSVCLFTGCFITLPKRVVPQRSSFLKGYLTILQHREFMLYMMTTVFIWAGFMSFVSKAPFIYISFLDASIFEFSCFYSMAIFGSIAGSFTIKKYTHAWGVAKGMLIGSALCLAASLLLGISSYFTFNTFTITLCMSAYLFGVGIIIPSCQTLAGQYFDESTTGKAFGLMFFSNMMAGSVFSIIVAKQTGIDLFILTLIALSLLSSICLQLNKRQTTTSLATE